MATNKSEIETIVATGKRRSWSRPVAGLVLVIVVAIAGYWYWQERYGDVPAARKYVTEQSRLADLVVMVTATGTVEPTNKVEISSELSGTIRAVDADYNDLVESGQVLARLDTDKLEATVEHSKATLAAAKASEVEAKATVEEKRAAYQRVLHLQQREVATVGTLESAKAAYDRAEAALLSATANVRMAEADLKLNETNFAKACICSPINGIVLERNVEVGQIVASSFQTPVLFTIAEDLRMMELQVDIDEADIGRVSVGDRSTFTVEAYPDRTFPAVITQLRFMPETVEGVVTYKAVLSIDNEDLALRPGMTATADIVIAEIGDALVVPNAGMRFSPPAASKQTDSGGSGLLGLIFKRPDTAPATTNPASDNGFKTVWVLRDGKAAPVQIRPGETDGSVTQVLDGDIEAGDRIITDTLETG